MKTKPTPKSSVPAKMASTVPARKGLTVRHEEVPDWVKEGNEGLENITSQDRALPRLMLCQALTPQRQKKDPNFIEGLEEGDFFNSVSLENFGPGPHRLTPIHFIKSRIKYVDAKKMGSGIDCFGTPCPADFKRNPEGISCRLNDGKACLHQSLSDPEPCFKIFNYPVIFHDRVELGPLLFSLRSTGIKIGMAWNSLISLRSQGGRVPIYSMAFDLSSADASNAKGEFKQARLVNAGWAPEELYPELEKLHASIADRVAVTPLDGTEEDEGDAEEDM